MRFRSRPALTIAVLIAVALVSSMLGMVPVWSQTLRIEALQVTESIPIDDPWAEVWSRVPGQDVPLSAQNIAAPFGGGSVNSVEVRALHDGIRLFVLLEWADDELNDSVAGVTDFSDAAAVQFPVVLGAATPYTMGGPGTPVNIWQWKAVWQADLNQGFSGTYSKYPNTYVDLYPNENDPTYRPAEEVGNPLAQRSHSSPVENLVAEGFGSLTSAAIQDVGGSGTWQQGTWRTLFVRELTPADEGLASFTLGGSTLAAFAVWDGGEGDRNGQKSIAQFVDLSLSSEALPQAALPSERGPGSVWILVAVVMIVAALATRLATLGKPGPPIRVEEEPSKR